MQDKSNRTADGRSERETKDRRIRQDERKTARRQDGDLAAKTEPGGNTMPRKTKKMIAVEERFHQPLEKILPQMVTEQGLSATADELEVSKATLGYWLLKLGINVRRVALAPGETIEIKRVTQG